MRKRQPDTEAQRLVQTYADLILRLGYTYLKSTHDAEDEVPDSAVLEAVMELSQPFREALYLHYYEGYTAREIADMTGGTEDAVAARLSRGRKKLRALLEGADDDR